MPRLLNTLSCGIDRRFALYRRMSASLGVDLTEDEARTYRAELRAALLACASCRHGTACAAWLDQGRPGIPQFCPGRAAFRRLPAHAPDTRRPAA